MIFVGSLTAFFINIRLKHPKRKTLSLDYNICIAIVPMLLLGTMVGVTLNKVFPSLVILLLLTFVLIINTYKTIIKYLNNFNHKEQDKYIRWKMKKNY